METVLFFCAACRYPNLSGTPCPQCGQSCNDEARSMAESLLNTILGKDPNRCAMAIEVLTRWLHDSRALIPLSMLIKSSSDPYSLTLAARGLGWLGNAESLPLLADLALDESKPYVARIAAIQALQRMGGIDGIATLEQAQKSPRPSVAEAAKQALDALFSSVMEK